MARLLNIFGFLAVLLRAGTLIFSSLAIGAVVFDLLILRTNGSLSSQESIPARQLVRCLLFVSAVGLALTDGFYLFANSALLMGTLGIGLAQVAGAAFFISGLLSGLSALVLVLVLRWRGSVGIWAILPTAVMVGSLLLTSHATARLDHQVLAAVFTSSHQLASAVWIGGLCAFLLSIRAIRTPSTLQTIASRFSRLSQITVVVLVAAGIALAVLYVGSWSGLYGTSYGAMVAAKTVFFILMLLLGGFNFLTVGRLQAFAVALLGRIQRFSEAEIGIGLTIVLTAASLTSQPPAVDLKADRATVAEIETRFTPVTPRLTTPPLSSLTPSAEQVWKQENGGSLNGFVPGQSYRPPTQGDIAWSEYNHHWAGIVVLAAGVLAVLSRFQRMRWARYWPLAFIGLGVFLLLRADPENWPLGPNGFWESFAAADVAQHRLFVLLICGFAFFEWGVQTGKLKSSHAALAFPLVCAVGGALLMTHTHALSNIREELLIELSHILLAIFAVIAGWSRWLELRLLGPGRRIAGGIWPPALMMVGVVLLLYREA